MAKASKPSKFKPLLNRLTSPGNSFLDFFYDMSQLGDVVKLPTSRRNYLINDPNIIQHILINNADNYTKEKTGYQRVEGIVGKGVLTNSGSAWAKKRQLLQPQFHTKNICQLTPVTNHYLKVMLQKWDEQSEPLIDFSNEMLSLTMNISAMALLGIDLTKESDELVKYIHLMNNYGIQPNSFIAWLPSLSSFRFKKAKAQVDKVLLEPYLTHNDKIAYSDIKPLLYELLVLDEKGNPVVSEEEYLGEAKNFFVAGHETTGNALSWTFYCILHHPYTLLEIRKELSFLNGKPPEFDDLEKLPYLEMVINEALRLFPPIWIMYRKALKDDNISGYHIPAGTIVTICNYYLHRNPKYWPNPRSFSPERFSNTHESQKRPKCAYLPFGSGPRVCIGKQFAMMNMKLIIATILLNYELKFPQKDYYIKPLPLITLKPKQNIKIVVKRK